MKKVKSKSKSSKRPHENVYTRLAPSQIHGVGVIAILQIPKGTFVFPEDNKKDLTWIAKSEVRRQSSQIRKLYEDFCITRKNKLGCPESFNSLTPAWYLNHSDTPNVAADEDYNFYSLRNIKVGEELTIDYSTYNK